MKRRMMRRRLFAAVWVAGATVPLLLATVMLVGCCVLPFHRVVHEVLPMCHIAANVAGGQQGDDTTPPAEKKQDPVKRILTQLPRTFRLAAIVPASVVHAPSASTSYRSFITHGAVRCDQDIGLHQFVVTFRI